jgi:hypothetical protein
VESMDDVFKLALHRVIVPQRMAGNFVIEVDDDEEGDETEIELDLGEAPHAARSGRKAKRRQ